jgi:hypothetical protein
VRLDFILLTQCGFIRKEKDRIELTNKGKEILLNCSELFDENRGFLKTIDTVTDAYSKYPPDKIKELVYGMEIMVPRIGHIMTIRDIPMSQLMLFKMSDERAKAVFEIDDSMLATLELTFDSEACISLAQAVDDAVEGRVHEFRIRDN